jgi:hypothetical protein
MALPEEKTNSTPDWLTAGSTRVDKPVTEIRGGGIYIPPGPEKPEKPREAPSGYRYSAGGNLEIIPGGPADPDSFLNQGIGKPL